MPDQAVYPMPPGLIEVLRPPEQLTVSQWCDRHRYLSRRFTAEAGRWQTKRTPYLREPLDAFADPSIEAIHFAKCARIGGTEWINNILAYSVDARPLPTMYVQPEKDDVRDEFTGRIRSIFESSERLREHIPEGEWATREQISLDSMDIYGAWATNQRTMIRKTIGLAVFDEIDNTENVAGPLGRTLNVLAERLVTFGHRAMLISDGTPTTPQASGWQRLLTSDYRKYHVPCPNCGEYQVLTLDQITTESGTRDPDEIVAGELARYHCPHCKSMLDWRRHQSWMVARGVWIAKTQQPAEPLPLDDREIREILSLACPPHPAESDEYLAHRQWQPRLSGEPFHSRLRGYWINALYSPFEARCWSRILAEFFRVKDDPDALRVFRNSWLCQPWEETAEKTDWQALGKRREGSYPSGHVPAEARILLMGADVQADHLYYIIRAWGLAEESWLIAHGTVTHFEHLYRMAFHLGFPVIGQPQTRVRCHAMAIDTRHRKDEVLDWALRPGVWPVAGVQEGDFKVRPTKWDYLSKGVTPAKGMLHLVNHDVYNRKVHRLAKASLGQPGFWHLPRDATEEYLKQFCGEQLTRKRIESGKKKGRISYVWEPRSPGQRVDYFDCEVYGAALADYLNVPLFDEHTPRVGVIQPPRQPDGRVVPQPEPKDEPDGWGGGFIG